MKEENYPLSERNCLRKDIYIYTVESKLGPRFGVFESKLGPRLRQNLVKDFFACFSPVS